MRTNASLHTAPYAQATTSGGRGRGFTLVEVLLAMVLTVVLMMALMMVASSSMQDRRRMAERQQEAEPAWLDQVARQIETDLLMGSGVSTSVPSETLGIGTRLYILTQASLGGSSSAANLPVLVSYRLIKSEHGGVLLREERPLTKPEGVTSTAAMKTNIQVVATGIESVQIGGTTLSAGDDSVRPRVIDARNSSAFTILVDNRPVAMQPVLPQVRFAITTPRSSTSDRNEPEDHLRTYERTLLTR